MLRCQQHAKLPNRAGPSRAKKQMPQILATLYATLQMTCSSNRPILPELPPVPVPDTPPTRKKNGRHWAIFADIGRHESTYSAKTRGLRSPEIIEPDDRRLRSANTQILRPTTVRTRTVLPGWERRIARYYQGNCLETVTYPIETKSLHMPPLGVRRLESQAATLAKSHGIKRGSILDL